MVECEQYESAITELERGRKTMLAGAPKASVAEALHLYANCSYELGHYLRALIKIKTALRLMRNSSDNSGYASMKLTLGKILVRLGRYRDAVETFNESYVFYKRCKDYESMLYPLNALAQVQFTTGNLDRSREALELSMEYAAKYRTRRNVDIDRRNLARVLVLKGSFSEALSLIDLTDESCSNKWGIADSERVRGYVYLLQLNSDLAEEHLKRCRSRFVELGTMRDVAVSTEYLGLLEYSKGNYRKARECYQEVLEMPEPTVSALAQTLRMLTDAYIAEGKFSKAMATAREAEEAITRISERIELGALYRAYGQIYTHKGDIPIACDYFKRSIDLLRQTGARYELALSYLACGTSRSYDRDERMRHLMAARMLFVDMAVTKRVTQVDDAIADLRRVSFPNVITGRSNNGTPAVVAVNPEMARLLAYAGEVAMSDLNVLLTGETGTGKDLFAHYIHCKSGREGRFLTLNAAAIPNEMVEAELFGYAEGAFTGAKKSKQGLFETAENGTICLNEIADATPEFQVKLLEVLETRRIRRLGETVGRPVNFRLIAASNRDLGRLIEENRFRRDLFHRLDDLSIELPPLSKRVDEIPALVEWFLFNASHGVEVDNGNAEAVERLGTIMSVRDYPGNVRELRARVNELVLSSRGDLLRMLRLALNGQSPGEREMLRRLLELTGWNRSRTAWILGVSEGTVRNRIKKHNLEKS
jgi:DNA-binding NtrC family response regulator